MTADKPVRAISVFDLDRTLTRQPTYSRFLLGAARRHQPWRLVFVPAIVAAMVLHKAGIVSRKRLKEFMHGCLLGPRIDEERFAPLRTRFVDRLVAGGLEPAGLAQLRADRAACRLIVLATAAPDYYADAIGERLGVDTMLSTRYRRDGTALTAQIDGANCFGRDKLRAIEAWLVARGLTREAVHVRVYADDRSDLPLFEWADEAVVINAKPALRALAAARGWTVTSWRSARVPSAP